MTNSEYVNDRGIMAGNIPLFRNGGISTMKFITIATVPYILPLIQTKPSGVSSYAGSFIFCNRQRELIWLQRRLSPLKASRLDIESEKVRRMQAMARMIAYINFKLYRCWNRWVDDELQWYCYE